MANVGSRGWKRLTYTLDILWGLENEVEEWIKWSCIWLTKPPPVLFITTWHQYPTLHLWVATKCKDSGMVLSNGTCYTPDTPCREIPLQNDEPETICCDKPESNVSPSFAPANSIIHNDSKINCRAPSH